LYNTYFLWLVIIYFYKPCLFLLNEEKDPVLVVHFMKHGKDAHGSIGFFSEIGTEAFFKDFEVEYND